MTTLAGVSWPSDRLGDAVSELVRRCGVASPGAPAHVDNPPAALSDEDAGRWLVRSAAWVGAEAEPVDTVYGDLRSTLARICPAIVQLGEGAERCYLAVRRRSRRRLRVLLPDLSERWIPLETLRDALAANPEQKAAPAIDQLLSLTAIPVRSHKKARAFLLAERLAGTRIEGLWVVRPSSTAPFWHLVRRGSIPGLFATLFLAHSGQYAALVASWFMIARTLGQEQVAMAWLAGWAMVMASAIPLRLLSTFASGQLGLEFGTLVKRRLLLGTLHLAPDETRRRGLGDLLGRVIEAEIVEGLGLSGAVLGITAVVEIGVAIVIMSWGAAPLAQGLAVVASLAAFALLWPGYQRAWEASATLRLAMTETALEAIMGHQTRLAQQPPDQWHDREDQTLRSYVDANERSDRLGTIASLIPRAFLIAATAALIPAFTQASPSVPALALSIGGTILVYRTLMRAVSMISSLAAALHAWKKTEPLLRDIPNRLGTTALPALRRTADTDAGERPVIALADDLVFSYETGRSAILKGCSLTVREGDRILLQGGSGSGKSTLCALIAGIREVGAGLLLVDGLDRRTLGHEEWRRRVVSAPQFHDNHIFSASLAFNLLLGRRWPPRREDIDAATQICQELGLGDLLQRMPGGIQQMVGDMGWQLSHGERSRVFVARTLLQEAKLVILDESFAALDPETLALCARSTLARASTLILVAHP